MAKTRGWPRKTRGQPSKTNFTAVLISWLTKPILSAFQQSPARVTTQRLALPGGKINSPVVQQQEKQPQPCGPLNSTTITTPRNYTLEVMGIFLYGKKRLRWKVFLRAAWVP